MEEGKEEAIGIVEREQFTEELNVCVKEKFKLFLSKQPPEAILNLIVVEILIRAIVTLLVGMLFHVWKEHIITLCKQIGVECPKCKRRRKIKEKGEMNIAVLGYVFKLPRLYLECAQCHGSHVSIVCMLTGLSSGVKSIMLKLRATYCAAKESYRKASDSLKVHYGQWIERTTVRKMALEIEQGAMAYVEAQRNESLNQKESHRRGEPILEMTADGGKVRTGKLVACHVGDKGYGQVSPVRQEPKRKWEVSWKELITFDIRLPSGLDPIALDVLVPIIAPEGERARRMLAMALRAGLGDNTEIFGLGDMGSFLAREFDVAFKTYMSQWCADWTHTFGYVKRVREILKNLCVEDWVGAMGQAIWDRDKHRVDKLLTQASAHGDWNLLSDEKCPIEALKTYLNNNWSYLHFATRYDRGLAYVSARAESQVRDRTKDRYSGPGVWSLENLEPKATVRAIIAEGKWEDFVTHQLKLEQDMFHQQLIDRLQKAVSSGCVSAEDISKKLGILVEVHNPNEKEVLPIAA